MVGIYLAAWPSSFWIWAVLAGVLWLGRRQKLVLYAGIFFGILRGAAVFHLAELPIIEKESHLFSVRVESRQKFGCVAKVLAMDSKTATDWRARLSLPCDIGQNFQGRGSVVELSSYEPIYQLPAEISRSLGRMIGRIKWDGRPSFVGQRLSRDEALRKKIFVSMESSFPVLDGLRRALIFGDSDGLSPQSWRALNYLGLSHALVISGSHLAFLILFFGFFLRRSLLFIRLRSHFALRIALIFFVSLFICICDRAVSIDRAFYGFLVVWGLAYLLPQTHRFSPAEKLSAVGVVIAALNPVSIFSASYQLSFGATWALLKSKDWGKGGEFFSYFVVAPICFANGFAIHPLSPLFNLLLLPPFFLILVPASLLSFVDPRFEASTNFLCERYFSALRSFSDWLQVWTPINHLPVSYAVFILFLVVAVFRTSFAMRLKVSVLLVLVFGYQLASFCLPFSVETRAPLEITALDVGQGDAFMMRLEDKNILIDGGPGLTGTRQVFPSLLEGFFNRVDLWVFTHFDQDHIGGYQEISGVVKPSEIWIPRRDFSEFSGLAIKQSAREVTGGVKDFCSKTLCLRGWTDPYRRDLLGPVRNQDSVALILFERESRRVLGIFLGDLFKGGEARLMSDLTQRGQFDLRKVEFLKVGHHGSNTSSSRKLLSILRPKIAMISSGRNNAYRHPHFKVLERLEDSKVRILRTDLLGNFKVYFDF